MQKDKSSPVNLLPRGARNAENSRRLKKTDFVEVEGLRLGRKPFSGAIPYYLENRVGVIAESTFREEERKLRYLSGIFEDLRSQGKIGSTDPRHIERKDIQQFLHWMKGKGLDPTAQEKYIQYLNNFLKAFRNFVVEEMKMDGIRFPKARRKPIRTLDKQDLRDIFASLKSMKGWHGSVARGMVSLCFATGVRPKEVRLAESKDLDLRKERFFVRHPKGEGSWASPEWVDIIRPDMIPLLEAYFHEREEYIRKKGAEDAPALFPALGSRSDGYYRAQSFWKIKRSAEEHCGIEFRLKDFRPTLTTMTIAGNLSRLPAMSVQLRHTKIETTQKFYANIEHGQAGRELKNVWMENPLDLHENPVIPKKFDNTGYV